MVKFQTETAPSLALTPGSQLLWVIRLKAHYRTAFLPISDGSESFVKLTNQLLFQANKYLNWNSQKTHELNKRTITLLVSFLLEGWDFLLSFWQIMQISYIKRQGGAIRHLSSSGGGEARTAPPEVRSRWFPAAGCLGGSRHRDIIDPWQGKKQCPGSSKGAEMGQSGNSGSLQDTPFASLGEGNVWEAHQKEPIGHKAFFPGSSPGLSPKWMTADKSASWKCYHHPVNLSSGLFIQIHCVLCVDRNNDAKSIKITHPILFAEW